MPTKNERTSFSLKHGYVLPKDQHWPTTRAVVLIVVTWLQRETCLQHKRWRKASRWQTWFHKPQNTTVAYGRSQLRLLHVNMQQERLGTFTSSLGLHTNQASRRVQALAPEKYVCRNIFSSWYATKMRTKPGHTGTS